MSSAEVPSEPQILSAVNINYLIEIYKGLSVKQKIKNVQ